MFDDLTSAYRALRSRPGYTIAVILTLALGLGLNSAMFSILSSATLRPLAYPEGGQLARLWMQAPGLDAKRIPLSDAEFVHLADRMRSLQSMGAYETEGVNVRADGHAERVTAARATASLFQTLGGSAVMGRVFSAREDQPESNPVVLLSHAFWNTRLDSDPSVLSKRILINGVTHTVVGVMPKEFHLPGESPALYTPIAFDPASLDPANHRLNTVARLRPGATLGDLERESVSVAAGLAEQYSGYFPTASVLRENGYGLQALDLREALLGDLDLILLTLQGAAMLVLLIACVNIATLGCARAERRRRELSLRVALGADRWRLIRQLLVENLLMGATGLTLGLFLAWASVKILSARNIWDVPGITGAVVGAPAFGFALLLLLVTLALSGLVPALRATRLEPNRDLRDSGAVNASGGRFRSGQILVMTEIALAVVLLVSAAMLMRSLWNLRAVDPGFRTQGVVAGRIVLPQAQYPDRDDARLMFDRLVSAVEARPEVESVAVVNDLPFQGIGAQTAFEIADARDDEGSAPPREAGFRVVSPGYFETMDIPVQSGRVFTRSDDAGAPAVAMIDESMARRFWPDSDPVGQRIRAPGPGAKWRRIVGVVPAVRHQSPGLSPAPTLYLPLAQMNYSPQLGGWRSMAVIARGPARATPLLGVLRHELSELDPALPLADARTMKELLNGATAGRHLTTVILASFAALALLLALIGVYGVIAFLTARRIKEFGIRMALGATHAGVLFSVLLQGLRLAAAGLLIGGTAALAATRLFEAWLFNVEPADPWILLAVLCLLVVPTAFATLVPALRTIRIQPTEALRYE